MIVGLFDDLSMARVNVLIWWIGDGAGDCVYTIIWHMRGYLRCYDYLARVRVQAFIKQVSLRDRTLSLSMAIRLRVCRV